MFSIDLRGKTAFIAGVGDDQGYGWAIAKCLAEAGCRILIGTWPPVMGIFTKSLERGKFDDSMILADGSKMQITEIFPLDAAFDSQAEVPLQVRTDKRYAGCGDFAIAEVAKSVRAKYGKIDILVHSLANGPEVKNPLLETSRGGYLAAASASAYSLIALVQHFGPVMNEGGAVVCLSYMAADRTVPGYGGGMSSAKAALQSDTRTLAYEAGRKWNIRVNSISAGPLRSRAAKAIGFIEKMVDYSRKYSPIQREMDAMDVGHVACFICSPYAAAITGTTLYVDNGLHSMAIAVRTSTPHLHPLLPVPASAQAADSTVALEGPALPGGN
jgi:enoyl-[acyl-carrier protein] reductase I